MVFASSPYLAVVRGVQVAIGIVIQVDWHLLPLLIDVIELRFDLAALRVQALTKLASLHPMYPPCVDALDVDFVTPPPVRDPGSLETGSAA